MPRPTYRQLQAENDALRAALPTATELRHLHTAVSRSGPGWWGADEAAAVLKRIDAIVNAPAVEAPKVPERFVVLSQHHDYVEFDRRGYTIYAYQDEPAGFCAHTGSGSGATVVFSTHAKASAFAALFPVAVTVRPAKARERKYGVDGDGFVDGGNHGQD